MEKKDKIQLGITGVLVVILLILLARAVGGKKQDQFVSVEKKVSGMKVPADGRTKEQSLYAILEEQARNLEFKRDPFFKQPIATSESVKELHLSGILWDDLNPTAIINDTIVTVGSQIEGKKVLDIQKNKVILIEGEQKTELILE